MAAIEVNVSTFRAQLSTQPFRNRASREAGPIRLSLPTTSKTASIPLAGQHGCDQVPKAFVRLVWPADFPERVQRPSRSQKVNVRP
jgi:hypothetical protein